MNASLPYVVLHPSVASALELKHGQVVHVPTGDFVGGAGKPLTPVTRPVTVVVDQYVPTGRGRR